MNPVDNKVTVVKFYITWLTSRDFLNSMTHHSALLNATKYNTKPRFPFTRATKKLLIFYKINNNNAMITQTV